MNTSKFIIWTFILFLLLSSLLVGHLLFNFITPIIMALVIVSLFSPMHVKIMRWSNNRAYLSASISTTLVFLCVMVPITLFIFSLLQQALAIYQATQKLNNAGGISLWLESLKDYLIELKNYLESFGISIAPAKILNFATNFFKAMGQRFYDSIGFIATNFLTLTFNFFLTVALVFVFFVSGQATKKYVMDLFPIPTDEKERLAKRFQELSSAVFLGNGLISIVEGLIGGLSFYIFHIPGALFWGVAVAIAAFLPLVGASIVIIPASIYLFLTQELWQSVIFLIVNIGQLIILETIVKPKLIGTKSQMHSALVFLSILAGVQVYGLFGLFYGPLLVTMFLSLVEIYKEHYRDLLIKN
ncbi:MAG: AI-2E family transporter [Myxococcales bacterium]|nr:AI-2E family transporter [Myxococcales bacterium]USN51828.1 MAG: AI-2E family transporter [Myxococcales bacterium]